MREGNVINRVCPSVSRSVHRGPQRGTMLPLPMLRMTLLYSSPNPDMGHHWTGTPCASDIWWPSLETCSNLFTLGTLYLHTSADIWWLHMVGARQYPSSWNVLLLLFNNFCQMTERKNVSRTVFPRPVSMDGIYKLKSVRKFCYFSHYIV